jgi:hypothetical protein
MHGLSWRGIHCNGRKGALILFPHHSMISLSRATTAAVYNPGVNDPKPQIRHNQPRMAAESEFIRVNPPCNRVLHKKRSLS